LFGGFEGDAPPSFGSFGGGEAKVFFGAAGENGRDFRHPQFRGFFYAPLEVVELEDGEQEMDRQGGVGFELFVQGEEDFGFRYGGDLSAVQEAVGDDVEDLARLGAEDAGEVLGLLAGKGGVGGVAGGGGESVGDPAAAHKGRG